MGIFTKKKILVTHNGSYHADDLFACAVLSIYLDKKGFNYKIIRTRDPEIIQKGDYVFDVGGEHDISKNRFDHHQKGGAGKRENGIPFASFGLVWQAYGLELCEGDKEVWDTIDKKIVCPLDAIDNGVDISTPIFRNIYPYGGEQPFLIYQPTWNESNIDIDDIFSREAKRVVPIIKREIAVAKADVLGKKLILESYNLAKDKRIVELSKSFPRYLYQNTLQALPEPLFIIYQSGHSNMWKLEAIRKNLESFENRKSLPKEWAGLRDEELAQVTGVKDATFCHNGLFLAIAKSKEGALHLAEIALRAE